MNTSHLLFSGIALLAFTHPADSQQAQKPRRDRNVITAEEIAEKPSAQNAHDLIRNLRPQWLSSRGPTTIMMGEVGVVVYRDGSKMGSAEELYTIPADQIQEMRFLSAGDATMRYGIDHPRGAIELKMKR
jgi:hypothetical protein